MGRVKRVAKKDKKAFQPTADALAAATEERRLYGHPLATSTTLFIEDREGCDPIRSKLGVKRELTIDRILRPAGKPVAAQRLRPTRASSSLIARVKKARAVEKLAGAPQLYDIWNSVGLPKSRQSTQKSTRVKIATDDFYSYRPDMAEHADRLCEMEMAMEQEMAKQSGVVDVRLSGGCGGCGGCGGVDGDGGCGGDGLTMEERADRDLILSLDPTDPVDGTEDKPHLDSKERERQEKQHAGNDNRKSKTIRNRDTAERMARERRHIAAHQSKLLSQVDRYASFAKLHRRQLSATSSLAAMKPTVSAGEEQTAERVKDVIPLLPGEVPQTMRLLPASHANPLREQFRRVCRSGVVRHVGRVGRVGCVHRVRR